MLTSASIAHHLGFSVFILSVGLQSFDRTPPLLEDSHRPIPARDVQGYLFSLETSRSGAEDHISRDNAKGQRLNKEIRADIDFLIREWVADSQRDQTPLPIRYANSLVYDRALLYEAGKASKANIQNRLLQEAADDIKIKADHCRRSSAGWATLVLVHVSTKKNNSVVSGLEVWYVPKGWADIEERWMRFKTLSSPADENLAPGNYMLRVKGRKPRPFRIGGDGKATIPIELPVQ